MVTKIALVHGILVQNIRLIFCAENTMLHALNLDNILILMVLLNVRVACFKDFAMQMKVYNLKQFANA